MKTRIISALIGVPLLIALILSNEFVVCAAVVLVALIVNRELFRALGIMNKKSLALLGLLTPFFIIIYYCAESEVFSVLVYLYLAVLFALMVLKHNEIKFTDVACMLVASLMVCVCLNYIVLVRGHIDGDVLIWAVFIGACISDTGAYFVGTFMGKHKLIPEVSPKKTVEGAVGAVIINIIAFIIYGMIISAVKNADVNILALAILGALSSVAAQLGDLTASVIKRECMIKDFGNVIPGHGGILDRVDSILFVAPLVYYFVLLFPVF